MLSRSKRTKSMSFHLPEILAISSALRAVPIIIRFFKFPLRQPPLSLFSPMSKVVWEVSARNVSFGTCSVPIFWLLRNRRTSLVCRSQTAAAWNHWSVGGDLQYDAIRLVRDQFHSLGGGGEVWFRGFGGSRGFQREQSGDQSFQTEFKKETLGNWLPMRGDQWYN